MATANRFNDLESLHAVHVHLITQLCTGYFNVESYFTKFRLMCRIYLTTPDEQSLSNPIDILDKLKARGIIRPGVYGKLKYLVKDIDADIVALIEEAEERISSLKGQASISGPKRQKTDTESSIGKDNEGISGPKRQKTDTESSVGKDNEVDQQSIRNLRQRLIKINNDMTKAIPLSPLLERGEDELPIEQLYTEVVIQKDPKYMEKGHDSSHSTKVVTDPSDIFTKGGEAVKKIYMTGDAGRGKTTYCLWLLNNWCNALQKIGSKVKELNKWEKELKEFHFVFLLQLCNFMDVQTNVASVIDMICQVVFESDTDHHATIRHVLSSNKYRSLIIIDGLDEWNPNEETRKHLIYDRMPKLDVSSTVSCFITMRPWVLSKMSKIVKNSDIVLEIFGLNEAGIEKVIKNVLVNRYNLKEDPRKCSVECSKIARHFSEKKFKSFIQIPLLTVVCVQILYETKKLGDSMTSFYAEMLNILIDRANEKHAKLQIINDSSMHYEVPKVLRKHKAITNCISVLLKLGKVAYEGLLSNETKLVFQRIELEEQIGEIDLQFALNVGFISQKEASSRTKKSVNIHFFHKSIQEFLAAIYIVTNKEIGDSFCKHLSNVEVIMELSNVVMFICGMCPSLGSVISQRFVSVTDDDSEICEYRKSLSNNDLKTCNVTVIELYKLQIGWYREIQCTQTDLPVTDSQVTFHVSDVYLSRDNDMELFRATRDLLSGHHVDMRTLYLDGVPAEGMCNITNSEMNDFLCNNHDNIKSLVMVCIKGGTLDVRSIHSIRMPSLRELYLSDVNVNPTLLQNMTSLRILELNKVTLGDGGLDLSDMTSLRELVLGNVDIGLQLSANMVHIEEVMLWCVHMLPSRWQEFIQSVLNIHHTFTITLIDTDIDDESETKIRSSPDFDVLVDEFIMHNPLTQFRYCPFNFDQYHFNFRRICQPSHVTQ